MKDSIASLHKYLIKNSHDTAALGRLAELYREAGKVNQSLSTFKKLIDIDPDNYKALNNYGTLLLNYGDGINAINIIQRANVLLPNSPIILSNLANAYTKACRYDFAIQACQQALSIQPDFFDALSALGTTLKVSGRYDDAITNFNKALEIRPDSKRIIVAIAESWHYLGENEKAYSMIKPGIDDDEPEYAKIYFQISGKLGLIDHAAEYILKILKKYPRCKEFNKLYFSLGKYYDKIKSYEDAFSYYYQANKLCDSDFKISETASNFDEIITSFPKDSENSSVVASNTSKQPIFILGMPRSGTSLVEQILSSHSQVFGAGELTNIHIAAEEAKIHHKHKNTNSNLVLASLDVKELDSIATDYLQYINEVSDNALMVTDKMPHNFLYVGFILRLFPSAIIINCARHPLDTCLSCYFSEFGASGHEYAYNLNTTAQYYFQYKKLMSHWIDIYGDKIIQVKYEELIMDHENTCKKLIQHCGLEWEEQCLDFHSNKKQTLTISYDQVNKPIYTKSMFRWKNYDKHLKKPKKILADVIQSYESDLNY